MHYVEDTIAAISTPPGQGAVALLRVSGPEAVAIAGKVFRGAELASAPARTQHFGEIVRADGSVVDQVLLTVFRAPASYTGEDVVEIGCHGGVLVSATILELLLSGGARAAGPGEFTQRAFLNGKMDLTQAEAVMDLISAQTSLALRAANEQLEGRLGSRIHATRENLLEVLAHIEAYIDFPEEDISPETGDALRSRMEAVAQEFAQLLATADQGRLLREGARTVICGVPNAGKSSLLNALSGFDRAIVSSVPGTTRDTVEESIQIKGVPLRLIDTAGIREAEDSIEKEGVVRTARQIERADLILEVVDAHQPRSPRVEIPAASERKHVLVLNKGDLGLHADWADSAHESAGIVVSCVTGDGLPALSERVFETLTHGNETGGSASAAAINARHQECLARASGYLTVAMEALAQQQPPELIAIEIRSALDAVGEVVGKVDTEDLLGVIFGSFCIGK